MDPSLTALDKLHRTAVGDRNLLRVITIVGELASPKCESNLLEIVYTANSRSSGSCAIHGGQKHHCQDRNQPDHDQEFDERETIVTAELCCFHYPSQSLFERVRAWRGGWWRRRSFGTLWLTQPNSGTGRCHRRSRHSRPCRASAYTNRQSSCFESTPAQGWPGRPPSGAPHPPYGS